MYRRTKNLSRGSSSTRTRSLVCVPSRLPLIFWTFLVGLGSLANLFWLLFVAYVDTSGTCSMLPRDKGGVVDPQLKVSRRMDSPAYVCTRTLTPFVGVRNAQLARRRSFHPPIAHRCSHPGYVLSHLVVPPHSNRYAVLILLLRCFLAYVYAMAEQGKEGGPSISFPFFNR